MQNQQFLLMYRSLTYAQRSARALERAGITGTVTRAPRAADGRGCGYCVIVTPKNRVRALELLTAAGFTPERVLLRKADGTLSEVQHDLS